MKNLTYLSFVLAFTTILFFNSCQKAATEEPCNVYAPAFYVSAHPSGSADTVMVNASMLFHNITSGGNNGTWLWDFGDGHGKERSIKKN